MIVEAYISFETAQIAKEKRFEEKVQKAYIIHKGKHNIKINGDIGEVLIPEGYNFNSDPLKDYDEWNIPYSKPTQSLLARWLREKHGKNVYSIMSNKGKYIVWVQDIHSLFKVKTTDLYDSYEKALEAGLQEALKLIK